MLELLRCQQVVLTNLLPAWCLVMLAACYKDGKRFAAYQNGHIVPLCEFQDGKCTCQA